MDVGQVEANSGSSPPFSKIKEQGENVVFLAITPRGLKDALRKASGSGTAVWCGAEAVSEEDFSALRGAYLTRFDYELGARDPLVLEDALDTIDQHHPDEVVWIEAAASTG